MASRKNHYPEDIVRLLQRCDELLEKVLAVELVCTDCRKGQYRKPELVVLRLLLSKHAQLDPSLVRDRPRGTYICKPAVNLSDISCAFRRNHAA